MILYNGLLFILLLIIAVLIFLITVLHKRLKQALGAGDGDHGRVADFILYESDRPFVTLKEELELGLGLVEINRMKVSPLFELRVKNKIDASSPLYTRELVAPMITIGLIGNAFKDADLQREGSFISIVFELQGDRFSLTVSNKAGTRAPQRREYDSARRANLQARLSALYPERHKLEQSQRDDIHTAKLELTLI